MASSPGRKVSGPARRRNAAPMRALSSAAENGLTM